LTIDRTLNSGFKCLSSKSRAGLAAPTLPTCIQPFGVSLVVGDEVPEVDCKHKHQHEQILDSHAATPPGEKAAGGRLPGQHAPNLHAAGAGMGAARQGLDDCNGRVHEENPGTAVPTGK